jgi:coenzyme F420-reducing hydrogenase delta subunit
MNAIKRQQEEQKRQAEEQAKTAAIQAWTDLHNKEDLQRKIEQENKITQGKEMISRMQTVGSSGSKLEPFSFVNNKLDFKPLSSQTYPAPSTAWEQALCAAYFSNMAKRSTKDVDVRFYADQAESVMSGGSTYVECKIPKVSNEKLAERIKDINKVYDEMNVKIKDLQDIEYKISESEEKMEKAELKKEEATTKLNELQIRAATAKSEERKEVDDLVAMAQKQLQDAEQELNQEKQSRSDALNKKEQLENELGNMRIQIKKIQTGDK